MLLPADSLRGSVVGILEKLDGPDSPVAFFAAFHLEFARLKTQLVCDPVNLKAVSISIQVIGRHLPHLRRTDKGAFTPDFHQLSK
jgi:hypothetical protein